MVNFNFYGNIVSHKELMVNEGLDKSTFKRTR